MNGGISAGQPGEGDNMKNQKSKKSDPTSRKLVLSIERLKPQTIFSRRIFPANPWLVFGMR